MNRALENEVRYGTEIREKYGDAIVDASQAKVAGMSDATWAYQEGLAREIADLLKQAMQTGDPGCELAQKACALHRDWICLFWKEGMYSAAAHRGLAEMYVADDRFGAYYADRVGAGAERFLRDAIAIYTLDKA
jgi:hypothetical protein